MSKNVKNVINDESIEILDNVSDFCDDDCLNCSCQNICDVFTDNILNVEEAEMGVLI